MPVQISAGTVQLRGHTAFMRRSWPIPSPSQLGIELHMHCEIRRQCSITSQRYWPLILFSEAVFISCSFGFLILFALQLFPIKLLRHCCPANSGVAYFIFPVIAELISCFLWQQTVRSNWYVLCFVQLRLLTRGPAIWYNNISFSSNILVRRLFNVFAPLIVNT
jgi:hypothetical protein